MMLKRKKHIIHWLRTVVSSKVLLVCIAFLFIIFFTASAKKVMKKEYVDSEIDRLKAEITQLQDKKTQFNEVLQYLESEEYVEDEARLKLGLQKPGERVMVITENTETTEIPAQIAYDTRTNIQKWWEYFFGM